MKKIIEALSDIDRSTKEGQLLIAALSVIFSENGTYETPEDCIAVLNLLK